MPIDVSIKYQIRGFFDPDELSERLNIVPDSTEKIGDYQKRFKGLPIERNWRNSEPFSIANWEISIRKDVDVLSFNPLFDSVVSVFLENNDLIQHHKYQNKHEFKALESGIARKIIITIHSVQHCYFFIDPKIIEKSLNICDEVTIYYFCDFEHDEGKSGNTISKFYIESPSLKRRIGGIIDGDASPVIGELKAATENISLDEIL